jgi:hypothetical protein
MWALEPEDSRTLRTWFWWGEVLYDIRQTIHLAFFPRRAVVSLSRMSEQRGLLFGSSVCASRATRSFWLAQPPKWLSVVPCVARTVQHDDIAW